jgi:hypothetical protein
MNSKFELQSLNLKLNKIANSHFLFLTNYANFHQILTLESLKLSEILFLHLSNTLEDYCI